MSGPTTNAEIRDRYEDGKFLNDGAQRNVATDAPANAANTVVEADTDVHVVTCDGTNQVDLSNVAEAGRTVTVVHNGGASTPTLAFADADFVGTGPANITSAGATATLLYTSAGWVVVSEGAA